MPAYHFFFEVAEQTSGEHPCPRSYKVRVCRMSFSKESVREYLRDFKEDARAAVNEATARIIKEEMEKAVPAVLKKIQEWEEADAKKN